jgi:hypothetical protein
MGPMFGMFAPPVPPPARAVGRLRETCGELSRDQMFASPAAFRPGRDGRMIYTPDQVIGFGDSTVALWTDDGHTGIVNAIPIERLLAVDDRQILLHGRLRLVAADAQLVIRYNTVHRPHLEQSLCDLRARMTPDIRATAADVFFWLEPGYEDEGVNRAMLPPKWRVVLDHPAIRPDPTEPVSVAVGDILAERETKPPATGLAVLSSRELVIASEPAAYLDIPGRFGVDILAVPRAYLDSLAWDGSALTVRMVMPDAATERAWVTRDLDPYLIEAMHRAFDPAVHWF